MNDDNSLRELDFDDLPELNFQEATTEAPLKSIFPKIGVEAGGYSPQDIALSILQGVGRDISQPTLSFINQFLLNAPRSLARKAGYEYPEEKDVTSPVMRDISRVAGIAGGVKNPLLRGIFKAPTLAKRAIEGAATGFLTSPTEDFTDIGQRSTQAGLGALLPVAGKGVSKAGANIGKNILNLRKTGRDYLYKQVAEPMTKVISSNLKRFPQVGKALGLKDETIELLNKHGYERVANPDIIEEEATKAFRSAMSQKTKVYGDKIDIRNTLKEMEKVYNSIKRIDPNNKILQEIDNLRKLQPAREGFYKTKVPTPTQIGRQLKGEKLTDIADEVRITREEFSRLRDRLNRLYREEGFDRDVFKVIDTMYDDAEKAGLKGINEARSLFRQSKEFASVSKDLAKIDKITPDKLHNDLLSVSNNPKKYSAMVDKYAPFLGKDDASKLFNEALDVSSGEKTKKFLGKTGKIAGGVGASAVGIKSLYELLGKNNR